MTRKEIIAILKKANVDTSKPNIMYGNYEIMLLDLNMQIRNISAKKESWTTSITIRFELVTTLECDNKSIFIYGDGYTMFFYKD